MKDTCMLLTSPPLLKTANTKCMVTQCNWSITVSEYIISKDEHVFFTFLNLQLSCSVVIMVEPSASMQFLQFMFQTCRIWSFFYSFPFDVKFKYFESYTYVDFFYKMEPGYLSYLFTLPLLLPLQPIIALSLRYISFYFSLTFSSLSHWRLCSIMTVFYNSF